MVGHEGELTLPDGTAPERGLEQAASVMAAAQGQQGQMLLKLVAAKPKTRPDAYAGVKTCAEAGFGQVGAAVGRTGQGR